MCAERKAVFIPARRANPMKRHLRIVAGLALLLSGCSIILVDDPAAVDSGLVADSGSIDPDGAVASYDGGVPDASAPDATPPECNRFDGSGCESGMTCKNGDMCAIDFGDDPACTPCGTSGQCADGLGCSNFCFPYCDASHPCAVGGCFQGFCVETCGP